MDVIDAEYEKIARARFPHFKQTSHVRCLIVNTALL
jgi:hypothetical protein